MIFAVFTRRVCLTGLLFHPSFATTSKILPPRLRVTLIRHGESENNILSEVGSEAYRKGRFADPPLTDLGRRQAQITAEYLCGDDCNDLIKKPDTIYVSPFLRTLQTSFPTASKLSSASNVVVWDDIFEISGCHKDGVPMGGLTSQEVAKEFGYEEWYDGPPEKGWYKLPGRESKEDALKRIKGVGRELTKMAKECQVEGKDRCVYLVVHGDFIDYLMETLLGIPTAGDQSKTVFRTYNCGLTSFDLWGDGMIKVLWVNFVGHLANKGLLKEGKLGTV